MDAKKKTFIEALRKNMGNVSKTCDQAKVGRTTFYDWKEADKEFKTEVENIDEYLLDFAENALYKQIKDGNTTATIFYLKTKGKKRGFIERQEVEQVGKPEFVVYDARKKDKKK